MFKDARSKKLVLVAHCILNQNSISDNTADFPGTFKEIVAVLLEWNVGILQLPCPELICLGLDRGDVRGAERPLLVENTRIRNALNQSYPAQKLKIIVDQVIYQIEEYLKNGFSILGIIGMNRSSSCGVETTSMNNEEIGGMGLFMKAIHEELKNRGIPINMIGVKTSEKDESLMRVKELRKNFKGHINAGKSQT
jgi:predicted secreted protein